MQKKLLPALTATLVGASLLVGAAFASSASSAGLAQAGGSEAKRGGTLRVNLSTTDFEFLDPAHEFTSSRVTNYLFHPVYGGAIMNALALR